MTAMVSRLTHAIPIIRIFDLAKAYEFYLDFLGFHVDWEHRYEEDFPLFVQVSRDGLRLYLSEHSGDATPGGQTIINGENLNTFHAELASKKYRFNRPDIQKIDDRLEVRVVDPFSNRISVVEVVGF